ncbi:MAG: hypothetical protein EXS03_06185 [Phycisphaerales bacterium]|nr:hypothetical protein [Phycisphaerales bacterium]
MNDQLTPTDGSGSTQNSARDRYIDALLEHHLTESEHSMEQRITGTMRALGASPQRAGLWWGWSWERWALPLAALVAVSFLFIPTTSSATSLMRSAIRAAAIHGDRQYVIEMTSVAHRNGHTPPPVVTTLDVRDAEHMRCEIRYPDGRVSVRGRCGDGAWEIHSNGDAVTFDRSVPWPRWIETPDGSLLVDSMSGVLEGIGSDYTLERVDANSPCAVGTRQVRATREASDDPKRPTTIDLCVDDASGEVTRLQMNFDATAGGAGPKEPRGPRHGQRPPPPHDGTMMPPPGPPSVIVFTRTSVSKFDTAWFDAPTWARPAPPRP